MRKMMTKEVTTTIVKAGRIEIVEGVPTVVTLPDLLLMGNVTAEKAQSIVSKEHGKGVSVISVQADTNVYEMEVKDFIAVATLKVAEESVPTEN